MEITLDYYEVNTESHNKPTSKKKIKCKERQFMGGLSMAFGTEKMGPNTDSAPYLMSYDSGQLLQLSREKSCPLHAVPG